MKIFKSAAAVLCFLLIASGPAVANGNAFAESAAPCTLYADPDFVNGQDFELGNHDASELTAPGGIGNDKASCIRVSPGYKVTLFKDGGFSGAARVYMTSDPWMIYFDDCVSSLKVEKVDPPATIYSDTNFGGNSKELCAGNYDISDLTAFGIGNDELSSIRVSPGYKVLLYENKGFNGSEKSITESSGSLGDFDNTASSLRVETAAPCTLYADPDFCIGQDFGPGDHDISEFTAPGGVGNDMASSIRVSPGYKVTLYKDSNFSGASKVYTVSNMWMTDFDDCVSSLKVELADSHAPVTVYSDANFGGGSQEFGAGDYDWADLTASGGIGNDKLSSIRVAPGYKVTLYENANFGGATRVITADSGYVADFNDKTSSLKVEPVPAVDPTCIQISPSDDSQKAALLQTFAPRIWMSAGEPAGASTVEFALQNMQRYLSMAKTEDIAKYMLKTTQPLNSPSAKLPYFAGDQANAKIYSFWTEKDYGNIDLSYWAFFPYDTGKVVIGSTFGCHVGDWEHITVRLAKFTENDVTYVKPVSVAIPAHSFTNYSDWGDLSKIDNTHPVVYCANGTHGMWKDPGAHMYMNIVVAQLTDYCDAGSAWDTWNALNTYQYAPGSLSGIGLGDSEWPSYFNSDYQNPNSGAVIRWGNEENGSLFGQPLRDKGPNGPESHNTLYDWVIFN